MSAGSFHLHLWTGAVGDMTSVQGSTENRTLPPLNPIPSGATVDTADKSHMDHDQSDVKKEETMETYRPN